MKQHNYSFNTTEGALKIDQKMVRVGPCACQTISIYLTVALLSQLIQSGVGFKKTISAFNTILFLMFDFKV